MKICYIANANSIHAIRWFKTAIEAGHSVYVVSDLPNPPSIPGAIEIIDLSSYGNSPKVRFVQWALWLRRYLKKIEPDILHAHQIPGAGWLGAMTNYKPLIVSCWGSDLLVEPHRSWFRRLLVKIVLKRTRALTVPSTLMYNAALELGFPEKNLYLIPWGIETDIFTPLPDDRSSTRKKYGIDPSIPLIFSPRSTLPIYNQDIVIAAFIKLSREHPRAQLAMIKYNSSEETIAKLQAQIDQAGIGGRVIWLEPQDSPHQMACLYRMADIVISIPKSEGYGFTVFEALACGIPTVITDLPAFAGVLEHQIHTMKVSTENIHQTYEALDRLLRDSNLRNQLSSAGFEVTKGLTTQYRSKLTQQLYNEVVLNEHTK